MISKDLVLGSDKMAFLVYGDDLGKQESMFINFLRAEGFQCKYEFWDCPWVWVNIDTKVYGRGRPGVAYAGIIGGHAITIDEFMSIYDIYKKYSGLKPLEFPESCNQ